MQKRSSSIVAFATAVSLIAVSFAGADVTPNTVNQSLPIGASVLISKVVDTPTIPPKPDIIFLADTTGSMGSTLTNVQTNVGSIMSAVLGVQSDSQFAAAQYKDFGSGDPFGFQLDQAVTANTADVQTAVNTWAASGGGDIPEAQINALYELATNPSVAFRPGSTRIVVWFGDATGHDPSNGNTIAGAIAALNAAGVRVIAVPVSGSGDGLDGTGQATAITSATGGILSASTDPSDVSAAILAGLSNLPITVSHEVLGCAPLSVTLTPASQTVTSGTPANFSETIMVPMDSSLLGSTFSCTVRFKDEKDNTLGNEAITIAVPVEFDLAPNEATNELIPGATHMVTGTLTSGGAAVAGANVAFAILSGPNAGMNGISATNASGEATFTYNATQGLAGLGDDSIQACFTNAAGTTFCDTVIKHWRDTIAPTGACDEGVNASGKHVPRAQKTNEDGFFLLSAKDNLDTSPQIFVKDAGTGTVFGPFTSTTNIKYVQAIGAVPSISAGPGAINWSIKGTGDALVYSVDSSLNESAKVSCLVPPRPK